MSPGQLDAADVRMAAQPEPSLLVDYAPVMIWQAGLDRGRNFFNQPWLDFTGRTLDAELGDGWLEGVHPEDRLRLEQTCLQGFTRQEAFTLDYRLRRHDGEWRWLLDTARPLLQEGAFAGFVGSCVDITDMRQALDERRRALAERELLLAELHHRVKNNAQATTSFLGLQASRATSTEVSAALRGAATRVMLATLVQDRMFRIAENAMIDLGAELEAIARSALDVVSRPGIALEAEVEEGLLLPVSQATPLALIVNELVVNAARHAFPDGHAGTIRLMLRRPAPGLGELVVTDDGIGLQEAQRRHSPQGCLGLHLVPRLARQAHASLRIEADGGTRATLRFACG